MATIISKLSLPLFVFLSAALLVGCGGAGSVSSSSNSSSSTSSSSTSSTSSSSGSSSSGAVVVGVPGAFKSACLGCHLSDPDLASGGLGANLFEFSRSELEFVRSVRNGTSADLMRAYGVDEISDADLATVYAYYTQSDDGTEPGGGVIFTDVTGLWDGKPEIDQPVN